MSTLNFYCLKNKQHFESTDYEDKLTKTNKRYLLVNCPLCKKHHSKFAKKDVKDEVRKIDRKPKKEKKAYSKKELEKIGVPDGKGGYYVAVSNKSKNELLP